MTAPGDSSRQGESAFPASEAVLQVARVASNLYVLAKQADGGWRVQARYALPGLPPAVQVGLAACTDWPACQKHSADDYDARPILDGRPDLAARFDWVRFRRPQLPAGGVGAAGMNPAPIPDPDLLRFLGGNASGE